MVDVNKNIKYSNILLGLNKEIIMKILGIINISVNNTLNRPWIFSGNLILVIICIIKIAKIIIEKSHNSIRNYTLP